MAASLREGASSSFPDSLFESQDFSRIGREEARLHAKSSHARRHAEAQSFLLPDLKNNIAFQDLIKKHSTVGLFAGRKAWFEAPSIESWLLEQTDHPLHFAYPRLTADTFEFRSSEERLLSERPPYGLREPSESSRIVTPSLIFVPCTLADLAGHRMGRGKGHFDRYLARHPGVFSVGVCHEDFLVKQFATTWIQPHDQDMKALITNHRFISNLNKGDLTK